MKKEIFTWILKHVARDQGNQPKKLVIFDLARNRFVGIKKVTIHVFSCLIAYLIRYVM